MDRDIYAKIIAKIKGLGQIITGMVKDVKIVDTSCVTDGVAVIPEGSADNYGVYKVGTALTVNSGKIGIINAQDNTIKSGASGSSVLTPGRQHLSVFYGLAKVAGDSSQSASQNEPGNYTDNAMDNILNMLGVSALVGRREASATPSANIAQNEAFIYQGKLYKATAAITTADTITPGTNCTETNLLTLIGG